MENTDNIQDEYAVNPVYHQSRLEMVDHHILKKNKIVSLFLDDPIVDQMKILGTQVLSRLQEQNGNSLLVTSPGQQEGKTFTATNLAISLSQKVERTVLLVDADLRHPSIHRLLGMHAQKGLSEYLLGEAEIPDLLINPDIAKLVFLPGGRALPNSTELLGSPRMRNLVQQMKARYHDRLILFDCPPLLLSADTLAFSPCVHGILLVVEAEKTSAKDLNKAMELLKDKPIIGTVFNKIR